ncbi:hypothetical protein AAFN88_12770 [Pelagibius sp. CAU 1746]|uniref:hypothetical protein n=1 Tax=Pelagibius sp. CAU 1746 TaxID=3140370 RepID=UPI00325AF156
MSDNPVTAGKPEAPASGGESGAPEAGADWRGAITEPGLRRVAEKFTSPAEVVKSYAALQSRLGRSVVKPGPDAGPEELAAYRRQLGVPESSEGYQVSLPEDLPEQLHADPAGEALQRDFLQTMHEAGASNEVVQRALDWYYGNVTQSLTHQAQSAAERRAEAEASLRREWGGDHERNLTFAQRAVQSFGDDGFVDFLESQEVEGVKLGDHPAFVRAFAAIGRSMGEDVPLSGEGTSGGSSLQARIDALHALQDSDPQKYATRAVQSELQSLYGRLYGGQPVVGSEGRRL